MFLNDPAWFLTACDTQAREFRFIRTSQEKLSGTAFHDGRTYLAVSSEQKVLSFDEAAEWSQNERGSNANTHIIAHMSFCGSTLLARLLEQHHHIASYREPNALVEVSNALAPMPAARRTESELMGLIPFVFSQYQKYSPPLQSAVVKPSNWANSILPDLVTERSNAKIVLLELSCRNYLVANLRGGRARVSYSLNLLNHISQSRLEYGRTIAHIARTKPDPQQQMLRLLVGCYAAQQDIFSALRSALPSGKFIQINKNRLIDFPEDTLSSVGQFFGLNRSGSAAARRLSDDLKRNAKEDKFLAYDPSQEIAENTIIDKQFGAPILEAIEWYAATYRRDFTRMPSTKAV